MSVARTSHARGASKDPLDAEVALLRAEVDQLRAFVSTIDGDMAAMEDMVEFLEERHHAHHTALAAISYGSGGALKRELRELLWPIPDGYMGLPMKCWWRRPVRRWGAYGSKAELKAMVRAAGIKGTGNSREWMIRALWDAGLLAPPSAARSRGGAEAWRTYAPKAAGRESHPWNRSTTPG